MLGFLKFLWKSACYLVGAVLLLAGALISLAAGGFVGLLLFFILVLLWAIASRGK